MGSRGAFVDVKAKDFTFVQGGQTYIQIGEVDGVKVLIRAPKHSVKAPDYSHSPNSSYAIVQDDELKHLTFYDENHDQADSIDLMHEHNEVKPHRHFYLDHSPKTPGVPPTEEQNKLIAKIKRRFQLK